MRLMFRPADWPITLKVSFLAMTLMLVVSFVISNSVLSRLAETQERHLRTLSGSYVEGLRATLLPHIFREDVWEVFDSLDRTRAAYTALNARNIIVLNASDLVIAASNPGAFPTGSALPPDMLKLLDANGALLIDKALGLARMLNAVILQGRKVGSIYTELDISALMAERKAVLWQLILTNAALTTLLIALGYWALRYVLKPVRTLSSYLQQGRDGQMEIIPQSQLPSASGEFGRLFRRYNIMAQAANERLHFAEKLADEKQLASLGRLASGMAHEINNPLGGLFNALDALKRYGNRQDVRDASIRMLERGLAGIRDAVRATLMTYRKPDGSRPLSREDIEDLRYLIQPAIRQKTLKLAWLNRVDRPLDVSASCIRDAALNLLLNACAASPDSGTIAFEAKPSDGSLEIKISDDGPGLPDDFRHFLESKNVDGGPLRPGSGLGLWMVRRLIHEADGMLGIEAASAGTTIWLKFPMAKDETRHVA